MATMAGAMYYRCPQAVAASPAWAGRLHSSARTLGGVKALQTKRTRVAQRSGRLCIVSAGDKFDKNAKFAMLDSKIADLRSLPPSEQAVGSLEASSEVLKVLDEMKNADLLKKFGSVEAARRRIFPRELTSAGIKNAESIGTPS
eukprot:6146571-Pyramimonas_sp.AAC.1